VEVSFAAVSGWAMYRTGLTSVAKVFNIFQTTDFVGITANKNVTKLHSSDCLRQKVFM
jgi:hypothetical protein